MSDFLKKRLISVMRSMLVNLIGEYHIFRIFSVDLKDLAANETKVSHDCEDVELCVLEEPTDTPVQGRYAGGEAYSFGVKENDRVMSYCWVWYGNRYKARNYWPLKEKEGKLIALETLPEARGRGFAPKLLRYAAHQMAANGFERMFARIWHSNKASVRVFEKAGWMKYAAVFEADILGKRRRWIRRY